ncbi:DUF3267 domain-containing protein [Anaerolineales bacterium HSG6]|nr:DUF3267 domain-containing protein [Anaerolineales bacterium HSG6]MDM8532922.1 DUF3267 domain-containing protein [Anaerolineales bacterium HSG25]
MNSVKNHSSIFHKFGGYYLIPHELLHVLAYRIIGKRCAYQWGAWKVTSLQPKTRREKLFVLLFPFAVCWGLGTVFAILWILSPFFIDIPFDRYFIDGPTWHFGFFILSAIFFLYGHTSGKDLLDAYGWLFIYEAEYDAPKPRHQADNKDRSGQEP